MSFVQHVRSDQGHNSFPNFEGGINHNMESSERRSIVEVVVLSLMEHREEEVVTDGSLSSDTQHLLVDSLSSFDLRDDDSADFQEMPTVAEHNMNSSSRIIEECLNQWCQHQQSPKSINRRNQRVRFNEITTVHVYNTNVPPSVPILFQPALQKTVLARLSPCPSSNLSENLSFQEKSSNFESTLPTRRDESSTTQPKPPYLPKKCASTAA